MTDFNDVDRCVIVKWTHDDVSLFATRRKNLIVLGEKDYTYGLSCLDVGDVFIYSEEYTDILLILYWERVNIRGKNIKVFLTITKEEYDYIHKSQEECKEKIMSSEFYSLCNSSDFFSEELKNNRLDIDFTVKNRLKKIDILLNK